MDQFFISKQKGEIMNNQYFPYEIKTNIPNDYLKKVKNSMW